MASAEALQPSCIIGIVLGVVALLLVPILGVVGAILGFVGYAKGDKPLGLWVGLGGIAATILGIAIGAVLLTMVN